eukprot:TRINITY_DN3926_c0_g1_i2.p1 TRINITY_DN3926_c0_g1~~TRINITY_DN3926_c0_g1_i2.p1  ORF type:complete len:713 (-),score=243.35 TRINITY_DN3926_c0_g1_i2:201-2339(-)
MADSLIAWINSFSGLSAHCDSLSQLSDGILLSEICAQVAPKFFDLSTVKRDVSDNWVLKGTNIKKLASNLDDFYVQYMGLHDEAIVNDTAIAKDEDEQEIMRLIKLILGVVVECEDKVTYIQNIMSLDETNQIELMNIIKEIVATHQMQVSQRSEPSSPNFRAVMDSSAVTEDEENEALFGHYGDTRNNLFSDGRSGSSPVQMTKEHEELKKQYDEIIEDYTNAMDDNANLRTEKASYLHMIQSLEDSLASAKAEAKRAAASGSASHEASLGMSNAAANINRDEDERAQLHAKLDEKDKTIADLKRKLEELKGQAQEARKLRDEVDLMRERLASTQGHEDKAKKYQRKVEEVAELKTQIRTLQENNDHYMKQTLDLEDTVAKLTVFKTQVDNFKQQAAALKGDAARAEAEWRSAQTELEISSKKVDTLTSENKSLNARVKNLTHQVEELQVEKDEHAMSSPSSRASTMGDGLGVDPGTKERLMRLERENKRLQEAKDGLEAQIVAGATGSGEGGEELERVRAQLEVAKKTIDRLRADLDAAKESSVSGGGDEGSQQEVSSLKQRIAELQVKQQAVDELIEKLRVSSEKITTLTNDKARLEGFLRTAKSMIKDLRERGGAIATEEQEKAKKRYEGIIESYQNQLGEKDKEVQLYKKTFDEARQSSQREQQLMITAFYEMGLELQKLKVPKPSAGAPSVAATPRSLLGELRKDM